VLNAAREGELVARQTVVAAADELVQLVTTLVRHFPGSGPVPIALAGGLLLPQSPLTAAFRERLAERLAQARLVPGRIDAAAGALKLAADG
jgi:N-acetylglucosamine kinase-like BadF-type ATPase